MSRSLLETELIFPLNIRQVIEFLTYAKVQAASYTTNNVIMTMGIDTTTILCLF